MLKCIKYEIRKIINNPWFYIGTLVMLILLILSDYTIKYAADHPEFLDGEEAKGLMMNGYYAVQSALNTASYSMVMAVVISAYICSDFSHGLLKNELVSGRSRETIFAAKYMATLVVSDMVALIIVAGGFVIGGVIGGVGTQQTAHLGVNLLAQILLLNGYISIYFFVATMVKRILPTVIINLVLPTVISYALSYSEILFHSKVHFYKVWLDVLAADLYHVTVEHLSYWVYIVIAIVYCVIFAVASLFSVKKVEV